MAAVADLNDFDALSPPGTPSTRLPQAGEGLSRGQSLSSLSSVGPRSVYLGSPHETNGPAGPDTHMHMHDNAMMTTSLAGPFSPAQARDTTTPASLTTAAAAAPSAWRSGVSDKTSGEDFFTPYDNSAFEDKFYTPAGTARALRNTPFAARLEQSGLPARVDMPPTLAALSTASTPEPDAQLYPISGSSFQSSAGEAADPQTDADEDGMEPASDTTPDLLRHNSSDSVLQGSGGAPLSPSPAASPPRAQHTPAAASPPLRSRPATSSCRIGPAVSPLRTRLTPSPPTGGAHTPPQHRLARTHVRATADDLLPSSSDEEEAAHGEGEEEEEMQGSTSPEAAMHMSLQFYASGPVDDALGGPPSEGFGNGVTDLTPGRAGEPTEGLQPLTDSSPLVASPLQQQLMETSSPLVASPLQQELMESSSPRVASPPMASPPVLPQTSAAIRASLDMVLQQSPASHVAESPAAAACSPGPPLGAPASPTASHAAASSVHLQTPASPSQPQAAPSPALPQVATSQAQPQAAIPPAQPQAAATTPSKGVHTPFLLKRVRGTVAPLTPGAGGSPGFQSPARALLRGTSPVTAASPQQQAARQLQRDAGAVAAPPCPPMVGSPVPVGKRRTSGQGMAGSSGGGVAVRAASAVTAGRTARTGRSATGVTGVTGRTSASGVATAGRVTAAAGAAVTGRTSAPGGPAAPALVGTITRSATSMPGAGVAVLAVDTGAKAAKTSASELWSPLTGAGLTQPAAGGVRVRSSGGGSGSVPGARSSGGGSGVSAARSDQSNERILASGRPRTPQARMAGQDVKHRPGQAGAAATIAPPRAAWGRASPQPRPRPASRRASEPGLPRPVAATAGPQVAASAHAPPAAAAPTSTTDAAAGAATARRRHSHSGTTASLHAAAHSRPGTAAAPPTAVGSGGGSLPPPRDPPAAITATSTDSQLDEQHGALSSRVPFALPGNAAGAKDKAVRRAGVAQVRPASKLPAMAAPAGPVAPQAGKLRPPVTAQPAPATVMAVAEQQVSTASTLPLRKALVKPPVPHFNPKAVVAAATIPAPPAPAFTRPTPPVVPKLNLGICRPATDAALPNDQVQSARAPAATAGTAGTGAGAYSGRRPSQPGAAAPATKAPAGQQARAMTPAFGTTPRTSKLPAPAVAPPADDAPTAAATTSRIPGVGDSPRQASAAGNTSKPVKQAASATVAPSKLAPKRPAQGTAIAAPRPAGGASQASAAASKPSAVAVQPATVQPAGQSVPASAGGRRQVQGSSRWAAGRAGSGAATARPAAPTLTSTTTHTAEPEPAKPQAPASHPVARPASAAAPSTRGVAAKVPVGKAAPVDVASSMVTMAAAPTASDATHPTPASAKRDGPVQPTPRGRPMSAASPASARGAAVHVCAVGGPASAAHTPASARPGGVHAGSGSRAASASPAPRAVILCATPRLPGSGGLTHRYSAHAQAGSSSGGGAAASSSGGGAAAASGASSAGGASSGSTAGGAAAGSGGGAAAAAVPPATTPAASAHAPPSRQGLGWSPQRPQSALKPAASPARPQPGQSPSRAPAPRAPSSAHPHSPSVTLKATAIGSGLGQGTPTLIPQAGRAGPSRLLTGPKATNVPSAAAVVTPVDVDAVKKDWSALWAMTPNASFRTDLDPSPRPGSFQGPSASQASSSSMADMAPLTIFKEFQADSTCSNREGTPSSSPRYPAIGSPRAGLPGGHNSFGSNGTTAGWPGVGLGAGMPIFSPVPVLNAPATLRSVVSAGSLTQPARLGSVSGLPRPPSAASRQESGGLGLGLTMIPQYNQHSPDAAMPSPAKCMSPDEALGGAGGAGRPPAHPGLASAAGVALPGGRRQGSSRVWT